MPWINVEIAEIQNPSEEEAAKGLKHITVSYRDEEAFKDSPFQAIMHANPNDHEEIRRQANELLAVAMADEGESLPDKGAILEALNAEAE